MKTTERSMQKYVPVLSTKLCEYWMCDVKIVLQWIDDILQWLSMAKLSFYEILKCYILFK